MLFFRIFEILCGIKKSLVTPENAQFYSLCIVSIIYLLHCVFVDVTTVLIILNARNEQHKLIM